VILLRSELYRVRPVILLFIVATSPHNTEDLLTIALIRVKERFSNTSDHSGPICFYTGRKVDTCDSLSSKTNQRSVKPCGKDCRPRATKSFSQRPGEDGFFLASNRVFDLIVLDVMLPGRDGLEVLAALRRQSFALKTRTIPSSPLATKTLSRRGTNRIPCGFWKPGIVRNHLPVFRSTTSTDPFSSPATNSRLLRHPRTGGRVALSHWAWGSCRQATEAAPSARGSSQWR
jgi:CheY-like chemotaxis protein